jgi:hypothetical protein
VIWGAVGAVVIVAVLIVAVIAFSAHGNGTTQGAQGNPATGTSTQPPSPQGSAGASPASTPAAAPATGSGYAAYEFTGNEDGTEPNYVYKLTLIKIDTSAQGTDGATPQPGTHFIGAEFTVTGVSGNDQGLDVAAADASVLASDNTEYSGVTGVDITAGIGLDEIDMGVNNGGGFDPAPGASQTGWVAFQVPNGVSVTAVEWQDSLPANAQVWQLSG